MKGINSLIDRSRQPSVMITEIIAQKRLETSSRLTLGSHRAGGFPWLPPFHPSRSRARPFHLFANPESFVTVSLHRSQRWHDHKDKALAPRLL